MTKETPAMEPVMPLPGAQLKKAREASGRALEDVAHEMHMKVWQLDELEKDNYDKLAGAVFVQGYIRAYARLLEIDAEPLLQSFSAQKIEEPRWEMHPPVEEAPGKSIWLAVVTGLVAAALVAAFVVWLNANGYLGDKFGFSGGTNNVSAPEQSLPISEAPVLIEKSNGQAEQSISIPGQLSEGEAGSEALSQIQDSAESQNNEPPAESGAQAGTPEAKASSDKEEQSAETELSDTETAAEEAPSGTADSPNESTTPSLAEDQSTPAPSGDASGQVAATPVGSQDSMGVVSLSFEEDSWVEVRDANGKLLIHGLRKAGFAAQIDGKAPYQVFLGNAPGVVIEIDGDSFDTTSYVRENRTARFLLQDK